MSDTAIYITWAVLLLIVNFSGWMTNLFALPGNWIVVGASAVFAWFYPGFEGPGVRLATIIAIVVLGILGEIVEFLAGAAGAAKLGASRRSILLAIVGAFIGSLLGASALAPIFIIGPVVGAIGGGALGAFAGTFVGEQWVGRPTGQTLEVSRAALWGRLFGTLGKFLIGAIMVAAVTADSFIGW